MSMSGGFSPSSFSFFIDITGRPGELLPLHGVERAGRHHGHERGRERHGARELEGVQGPADGPERAEEGCEAGLRGRWRAEVGGERSSRPPSLDPSTPRLLLAYPPPNECVGTASRRRRCSTYLQPGSEQVHFASSRIHLPRHRCVGMVWGGMVRKATRKMGRQRSGFWRVEGDGRTAHWTHESTGVWMFPGGT